MGPLLFQINKWNRNVPALGDVTGKNKPRTHVIFWKIPLVLSALGRFPEFAIWAGGGNNFWDEDEAEGRESGEPDIASG